MEEGELGPHLTQCGQAEAYLLAKFQPFGHNTPTSQTDRQTGQLTDSIGRTVLQTVAQKLKRGNFKGERGGPL